MFVFSVGKFLMALIFVITINSLIR